MHNCTQFEQCQSEDDIIESGTCRDGHQFTQIGIVQLGKLTPIIIFCINFVLTFFCYLNSWFHMQ
jgi:hypothetical protein